MDRISDSGSDDLGSIPNGGTSRNKLSYLIGYESTAHIMKRILISLAAAIFAFVPVVSAQTPESRNEIMLGYGRVTVVDVAHVVGGAFATAFTAGYARFDNFRSYGSVNLEYYRALNKTFSVGAAVSWFGGTADELNKDNVKVGNADYSGFAVMPAAKVFWFRKPHVAMYSKLAAGVTLLDDYDEAADSHSFDPYWAAQVTLAGVQFGGERFRGFVEAGAGMQGLVLAGLSVSF